MLRDLDRPIPESEYLGLEYMDWKSGGDTNFAPVATADGELDCRGLLEAGRGAPRQGRSVHVERAAVPEHRRRGRVGRRRLRSRARDQARAADATTTRCARSTATTTTGSTPTTDGWVVRSWLELTDNPDSFMVLMEQGADGLPDPSTEVRVPLHRGVALRRRHATALARRVPHRRRAALRADLQLRERPRARSLDRVAAPLAPNRRPRPASCGARPSPSRRRREPARTG